MLLSERWIGLFPGHTNGIRREALADLDSRYRESHRHYHTWRHIESCLALFDRFKSVADRPLPLELAIWYHDAVYRPGATDNESESAVLFCGHASRLDLSPAVCSEVKALILSTRHDAAYGEAPSSGRLEAEAVRKSAKLLCDIDISILGAAPSRYNEYAAAVRAEYAEMDPRSFASRRREFLEHLLGRRKLFHIRELASLYEEQARANIQAEIDSITAAGL